MMSADLVRKRGRAVIVSGGSVEDESALEVLKENYEFLIAADHGLDWLHEHHITPTHIVGDFDSSRGGILEEYRKRGDIPIQEFNPVKDASDTEIALRLAVSLKCGEVVLLGATGTRIDHVWANVQSLYIAKREGIFAWIVDGHNRIRLIDRETRLKKEEAFGEYFSLFSLSGPVEHLYITGAKYPLSDHLLYPYDSLCVSNQIEGDEAVIRFQGGVIALIETKD